MNREQMVNAICKHNPCHGREGIERWSRHWPKNVSLLWLLEHPQRGSETVSLDDRLWLACRLAPKAAAKRALRVIVLRAVRVHAAAAMDSANLPEQARALRAVPARASYETMGDAARAAWAAARAAARAAAWAAARAAAWDAAGDAARDAARAAGDAARDAAGDAAWAARDAAGDAAGDAEKTQQIKDFCAAIRNR